jgi:hypothetical protein
VRQCALEQGGLAAGSDRASGGRQARGTRGGGGLSGMMYYIGAMLGVQPLDRRGPALMNSAIFDLFKHFQMDLN